MSKATNKSTIESIIDAEVQRMVAKMPADIFAHGVLSNPKNFNFSYAQVMSIAQAVMDAGEKTKSNTYTSPSANNP